jgi:ABC-type branched-subunit amino acid transport system substrate-binding protein
MMPPARWRFAIVALLFTVGIGAGCGGAAASGPPPIRIGGLLAVTGIDVPNYLAAAEAAAREINSHGGVGGRRIEIDNCDDASDPNLAQGCARRLVTDHVIATAGNLTGFGQVEAPILDEAGIAEVGSTALSREESTLPTMFPMVGGLPEQLTGAILSMRMRGLHSMFMASYDQPTGKLADMQVRAAARSAGLEFAGDVYIPSAATVFTPYARAAVQSRADVLVIALPAPPMLAMLDASNQIGARYRVIYPGGELQPRQIAHTGGANGVLNGCLEFDGLPPLEATDQFPALRTFKADMDAEYAAGDKSAAPELRTPGTLGVWLSVQVLARLAAALPTIDAASILRALRTSPTVDTLGLTPPWTPGRPGSPAFPRVANPTGYFITQRNGQEVLVDPAPVDPFAALGMAG